MPVRRKGFEVYKKVIELRKKEFSYSEIRKETGIAKSTINNWLTHAGLTLSRDHIEIQAKKRTEGHIIGTAASKLIRERRKEAAVQLFIQNTKQYFEDPFFVAGIMLYQAEGSKTSSNNFSNSDFRLIQVFMIFLEKYFSLDRNKDMRFRLRIHESRKDDLSRIIIFWAKKLSIDKNKIRVNWKHNFITKRRTNMNYVGQFDVRVYNMPNFISKLLAISDIILSKYQKV